MAEPAGNREGGGETTPLLSPYVQPQDQRLRPPTRDKAGALDTNIDQVVWPLRSYSRYLLNVARNLIQEGGQSEDMTIARRRFSLAVIVAHTACEIATERKLFELLSAKGTQYLEDWVRTTLSGGYNLSHHHVRRLYTTLTRDEVQKDQTFWRGFTDSVKRRNDIVHRGEVVEKKHAEASYNTANDLLARLNVGC